MFFQHSTRLKPKKTSVFCAVQPIYITLYYLYQVRGRYISLTLKQFYEKFRKKHQLQLIAGEKGIYTSFKWIYLLEDLNNMSFIRGGELIITTGLANSYDHWLEELIYSVNKKGASGIILNIGNYIKDIPESH